MKKLFFYFFIFYFFILFSGLNFFWSFYPYDGFRILQIILIFLSGIYILFSEKYFLNKKYSVLLILLCLFVFYSSYISKIPFRSLQDGIHFLGLIVVLLSSIDFFKKYNNNLANIVCFLPILTLIFLPISLIERMFLHNPYAIWTQSFDNVRMLDDALLPLFFLNIYIYYLHKKNKVISLSIFFILTLFFLNFFLNGSRSIFISIFSAFFFLYFLNKNDFYKYLKIPFLSFIFNLIILGLYKYFNHDSNDISVFRYDSSGRIFIWKNIMEAWIESPIWGIGGNHMFLHVNNNVLHPHNFILMILTEYGLIVFLLSLYFGFSITQKIWKNRNSISSILLVGLVAIFINSLLSGSMVYPASQMLNIFYVAFVLSFLSFTYYKKNIYIQLWVLIIITTTLHLNFQNITCIGCISIGQREVPRFWHYGSSRNLVEYDEERIGKKLDISEY